MTLYSRMNEEQAKEEEEKQQQPKVEDEVSDTSNNTGSTKRKTMTKEICIFGLSGDPPTGETGHVGIIRAVLNLNRYDEIYILPVYKHTYANKRKRLVSFEDRFAMCQLAFNEIIYQPQHNQREHEQPYNIPVLTNDWNNTKSTNKITKVIISDLERDVWNYAVRDISDQEQRNNVTVGTASLLDYLLQQQQLQQHHHHQMLVSDVQNNTESFPKLDDDTIRQQPQNQYTFCLGSDAFLDLMAGKWKEGERIVKILNGRFLILYRKQQQQQQQQQQGTNPNNNVQTDNDTNDEQYYKRIQYYITTKCPNAIILRLDHLDDISSTKVRQCNDLDQLSTMIPQSVVQYIQQHHLYQFANNQ